MQMDIQEFEELLSAQPLTIVSPPKYGRKQGGTCAYFDIKNNTDTDIRSIKVDIVAWKEDTLPVSVSYGSGNAEYYYTGEYWQLNLLSGEVREFFIAPPSGIRETDTLKAIIVSYTDYNGTSWHNPYISAFRNAYPGKEFSESITIEVAMDQK